MRNSTRQRALVCALLIAMLDSLLALSGCANRVSLSASKSAANATLPAKPDSATQTQVVEAYGRLPLSFEANEGQVDSRVKFISRSGDQTFFLTSNEQILMLRSPNRRAQARKLLPARSVEAQPAALLEANVAVLRMKLIGANARARLIGLDRLPGKSNHFIGSDPKTWRVNVPNYARVKYECVYRGIDLVYYGDHRQLEYDLIVAAGADPNVIRLSISGMDSLRIDESGDLVFSTAAGEIRQKKPSVYQYAKGSMKSVAGRYVRTGERMVGFELGAYDRSQPVVIDPVLTYSTFLGGTSGDFASCIAIDSAGNAYVGGTTASTDFPTLNPIQPYLGSSDAFITKLNASGSALIYSTYLGGHGSEPLGGIAIDSTGNAYVVGYTDSSDFPTKNPLQGALRGGQDAFVTKIDDTGSGLVYSTYLGGTGGEWGLGIAVDDVGDAYLSGATFSTDFPTVNPVQATSSGAISGDAFVTKLDRSGSTLLYSTYLGGYGEEAGERIAVDSSGAAYIVGYTRSPNFPTASPLQTGFGGPCFKTSDGSSSWNPINNGFASWAAPALAISTSNPTTLYAAGERGSGIFRSTDGGANWVAINNGLVTSAAVTALAVDPKDSSTVYAAYALTMIKSTNGGASWFLSGVGISSRTLVCIAIDPTNTSTLYAGVAPFGPKSAFRSTDAGATWIELSNGLPGSGISSIAIDPMTTSVIYAGSNSHAYKSTNGGDSWTGIFFSSSNITPLAIDPSNTSTIYLGASNGVLKSTNGGTSFSLSGPGITGTVNTLVIDPLNPSVVYAGRGFSGGIYKTSNAGATWSMMSSGLTVPNIKALAINPLDPSTLFVGTSSFTDAFVTKLNASGSALVYSTYLGGSFDDLAYGVAVDSSGNAYATGLAASSDFPTVNALQTTLGGDFDAFVAKINASGSALVYSTYLGGDNIDEGLSIALDSSRNAYICGFTQSTNFPTVAALQTNLAGSTDGFVAKISATGSVLIYSTYLGGSGAERAIGIAVDSEGSAYIAGFAASANFPTTPGAFQVNYAGGSNDAFVAKIGSPCAYSLSRTSQIFPMRGGSGSVDLTTTPGCGWTAVSSDNWIVIVSADAGSGGGNIAFGVRENLAEQYRIGTLTIAGQVFTIIQEGLASASCSYAISPTNSTFAATGGERRVDVATNGGCIWRAESNTSWVRITSNDYGVGAGAVMYSVDANPSAAARKAMLTIAGQILAIKQKGMAGGFKIKP